MYVKNIFLELYFIKLIYRHLSCLKPHRKQGDVKILFRFQQCLKNINFFYFFFNDTFVKQKNTQQNSI